MTVPLLKKLATFLEVTLPRAPGEKPLVEALARSVWGDAVTENMVKQALASKSALVAYCVCKTLLEETDLFEPLMEPLLAEEFNENDEIEPRLEELKVEHARALVAEKLELAAMARTAGGKPAASS